MRPATKNYETSHKRKIEPTWKNIEPTKHPREKILDSWIPTRKHSDPVIFTIKNLGPTKYPQRRDGTIALDPRDSQWHTTHEISSYI